MTDARFWKHIEVVIWILIVSFWMVGLLGICDGIRSVLRGGYADNIVLGLMVACLFPLPLLGFYYWRRSIDKEKMNNG